MYLDTQTHRALLATLRDARAAADRSGTAKTARLGAPGARVSAGVLRVLAGSADRSEYRLEPQTSLIGASDTALVRLRGWFKPKVAVAIARNADGYVATRLSGRISVNGEPLIGRHELRNGDMLRVCGLTLEFCVAERAGESAAGVGREALAVGM